MVWNGHIAAGISCGAETVVRATHPRTMSNRVPAGVGLRLPVAGLAFVAAFSASIPEATACSICGCGDPLLAASDPAAITGLLRLQLDTEYLRVDAGTDNSPGYTDELTQWSYRLNAVYRPITQLSLIATLPALDKTIHTVGGGTDVTSSHLTGLGDAELGARYALWRSVNMGIGRVQEFALAGGISRALTAGGW